MMPMFKLDRRTVLKAAAAAGVLPTVAPFIISARGESPVRIGMVRPELTSRHNHPAVRATGEFGNGALDLPGIAQVNRA